MTDDKKRPTRRNVRSELDDLRDATRADVPEVTEVKITTVAVDLPPDERTDTTAPDDTDDAGGRVGETGATVDRSAGPSGPEGTGETAATEQREALESVIERSEGQESATGGDADGAGDIELGDPDLTDLDIEDDRVADLVREHEALIADEVRAADFGTVEDGHRTTWDVEGVEMDIAITPVDAAEASD